MATARWQAQAAPHRHPMVKVKATSPGKLSCAEKVLDVRVFHSLLTTSTFLLAMTVETKLAQCLKHLGSFVEL